MRKLLVLSLLLFGCAHSELRQPAQIIDFSEPDPICKSWSDVVSPQQQQIIFQTMGNRTHRLKHALWHAARGGLNKSEKQTLVATFGSVWNQAKDMCPAPDATSDRTYNVVGEDFLYMHREMVHHLQAALAEAGQPCIKGWAHVPTVSEAAPPDSRNGVKSDAALVRLQEWEAKFRDRDWLKSKTLSEVGWALENTIHNNLHMRFATDLPPKGYKDAAPISFDGSFPATWTFDQPAYNWLADPYGAAVNPTFWKIHGFVDSIIDSWLDANDYKEISEDCSGKTACYQWKGTWVGEVTFKKSLPTLPHGGLGSGQPSSNDDFTKKRLELQRLGVLTEDDLNPSKEIPPPGGGVGAPRDISTDPYLFAKKRVCNE